jgi:hypothetical protein
MVVERTIELEESEVDPNSGWPVQRARLAPAIIKDMNETGGFWVGFRSIAWMLGGHHSTYAPNRGGCVVQGAEWEEWFQT